MSRPAAPQISALIPTYAAEHFIDRTLQMARAQTYSQLAILVSVDACDDGTRARVEAHAAEDARIVVFTQERRLGWAGNVNFLLDQVRTPYFFVYFHDDEIAPEYVERLLAALEASPQAASAHCDVQHFGASDQLTRGREYSGEAVQRVLTFMLAPYRGAPLRSLVRRDRAGHLRLPSCGVHSFLANEPFLLDLIAAGPARHVPAALYRREELRPGGVTRAWRSLDAESALGALRAHAARALETLDGIAGADAALRTAFSSACWLWLWPHVREAERRAGRRLVSAPSDVHPAFTPTVPPEALAPYGSELQGWYAERWQRMRDVRQ